MIEVKNLKKHFYGGLFRKRCVKAVDGVSFRIASGESLGLVGESGSGKTTVGRCMLRLIEPTAGEIHFRGKNILAMNGDLRFMRQYMQIIFQDANGSLNPRMKAIDLVVEPFRIHKRLNGQARETAAELMNSVGLSADLLERFPHELSGGQRQRIGVARAISINPALVVADEAAASLDPIAQLQMMDLFKKLEAERGISFLYISHNLNMIRRLANRMAVMYRGRFVEFGETADVCTNAAHPYTQALLSAVPSLDPSAMPQPMSKPGELLRISQSASGCYFHPRCPHAQSVCAHEAPAKRVVNEGHWVWCHA
ncbi:MAG: ABC transporter ATP-binding protein [Desulfatitalea sp.]